MTRTKAIETTTREQSEANDTTEHRASAVEPAVCGRGGGRRLTVGYPAHRFGSAPYTVVSVFIV